MIINCRNCHEDKTSDQFGKDRSRKSGFHPYCKVCKGTIHKKWAKENKDHRQQYNKEYDKTNKDKRINQRFLRTYGISVVDFQQMLQKQNGLCAVCKLPEQIENRQLSIDHNHKTGQVRELLCQKCNAALGLLEEDIDVITNLLNYIKKHRDN